MKATMEERVMDTKAKAGGLLNSDTPENRMIGMSLIAGAIGVKEGHVFWKCIRDFHGAGQLRVVECTVGDIDVTDRAIRYEYSCWIGEFTLRVYPLAHNREAFADLLRGYAAAVGEYREAYAASRKVLEGEIAERQLLIKDMETYLEGLAPAPIT